MITFGWTLFNISCLYKGAGASKCLVDMTPIMPVLHWMAVVVRNFLFMTKIQSICEDRDIILHITLKVEGTQRQLPVPQQWLRVERVGGFAAGGTPRPSPALL